ncbi:MAG TPA: insulinase family protein [Candidatus Limnocylindrales bacterium]|nr:insulinase family protein [Candidatus Limnocylindrales bacterium]
MSHRGELVAERPVPGHPRPYDFPHTHRTSLANGLQVIVTPMPGRQLISASLAIRSGAADEPHAVGGATVLAARALTEGTEVRDAIELTEAAERLGASLHAEAGWDATSAGLDVPASRLAPAMELLAEVVRRPSFPASEVERLRDERLTDLLQAKADPRRRADEAYVSSIYAPESPYHRPAGGTAETVATLTDAALRSIHARAYVPTRAALVVAGEVDEDEVLRLAESLFGDWAGEATDGSAIDDTSAVTGRFVRVVHRPGAVQTEIRIGHPGLARRNPDFHAVSVMGAILGGLFNSRLNMKLREEKGYTYGASAGFDLRRARGPFTARAAVNTEATIPALQEFLSELDRIRGEKVTDAELRAARDYLVGVFPLRFETPGPVAGSLAGLFVHGLPDDELARYRGAIEAVTAEDVLRVAQAHVHPDRAAIVLVGDHDTFAEALEAERLGPIEVIRDAQPAQGPQADPAEQAGPVDAGEGGPAEGAEDPDLPGTDEPGDPGADESADLAGTDDNA